MDWLRKNITVSDLPASVRLDWAQKLKNWPQQYANEMEKKGWPAKAILKRGNSMDDNLLVVECQLGETIDRIPLGILGIIAGLRLGAGRNDGAINDGNSPGTRIPTRPGKRSNGPDFIDSHTRFFLHFAATSLKDGLFFIDEPTG